MIAVTAILLSILKTLLNLSTAVKNSLINQRELGHDTWSFTAALRSALREEFPM